MRRPQFYLATIITSIIMRMAVYLATIIALFVSARIYNKIWRSFIEVLIFIAGQKKRKYSKKRKYLSIFHFYYTKASRKTTSCFNQT